MADFQILRKRMIEDQLKSRDIRDPRVLEVFLKVPRHLFIDENLRLNAYEDYPLPIGSNQTISQPYIVALMVQCLNLKNNDRVLEIGTGSGYQTAILAELAKEVYSVERIQELAEKAQNNLAQQNYANIKINVSDGTLGWDEFAPFDAIIVSAAGLNVPPALFEQLQIGGRLAIPLGGAFSQTLTIFKKQKDGIFKEEVCGCVFVPLIGKEGS